MKDMTLETPPKSDKRKWEPCLIVNNEGEKFNCWGYKTISPHLMVTPMMATQQIRMEKQWVVTHIPTGRMVYGHDRQLDDPQIIIDLANELAVVEGIEWGFIDTTTIIKDPKRFQPARDIINRFNNINGKYDEGEEFDDYGNSVRASYDVPTYEDTLLD